MADCMNLPKTPIEFLKFYEFKDDKEIYTNGSMLIPTFRVYQMIECYFSSAQTSDVQEVKHGEWINIDNKFFSSTDGKNGNTVRCSVCGEPSACNFATPYCSICGARMDGDTE